jgi:transposase
MGEVIVGVDPHKKSVTIEAIDGQGKKLATGRFGTGNRDYQAMLGYVSQQ